MANISEIKILGVAFCQKEKTRKFKWTRTWILFIVDAPIDLTKKIDYIYQMSKIYTVVERLWTKNEMSKIEKTPSVSVIRCQRLSSYGQLVTSPVIPIIKSFQWCQCWTNSSFLE